MSEHPTGGFTQADDETSYDWNYDEPRRGGVLWGRVLALAVIVVVAFWLGRLTSGGDGGSQAASLQTRLEDAQSRVAELEAQAAADASQEAEASPSPPASQPPDEGGEAAGGGEQTYTVKPGDTLRGVAETFYGDVTLDDYIAEANDITNASELNVGQELVIPPEP